MPNSMEYSDAERKKETTEKMIAKKDDLVDLMAYELMIWFVDGQHGPLPYYKAKCIAEDLSSLIVQRPDALCGVSVEHNRSLK